MTGTTDIQQGAVTLDYETETMTQDSGRMFQLDPMDINEANFVTDSSLLLWESFRECT